MRSDQLTYSTDNTLAVAPAVAAWLAARVPEAAAAGGADALARAVATFSFNAVGVERDGSTISALYERLSKVSHACNWAANTTFHRLGQGKRAGMLTLAPIAAGSTLLYDYMCADTLHTTTVRRHLLRRSKMFDCYCEACAAPDQLAALPCPVCVPRDPDTGLIPLSLVKGRAGEFFTHPVVVPDGVCARAPTPPAWRCDTCHGVFSAERMAVLQIAAGVCRPSPRTSSLVPSTEPAALLDVARWAEAATSEMLAQLPRSSVSSTPETKAEFLLAYMNRLAPIVGNAHASMLRLRCEHLKALHLVIIDMRDGVLRPTAATTAKRLSHRVPLLDVQLPALQALVDAGIAEGDEAVAPPFVLATAITAGVAAMWQRLRAAGLLRPTSTSSLPANLIMLIIQLVHCLGMERELAKPLRAMLRELPPSPCFSANMQLIIKMCHDVVRD